jgi:hypothetical protein
MVKGGEIMEKIKCIQCGEEFEGSRSTAKYCGDKCKSAHRRGGVSVSEVSGSFISGSGPELVKRGVEIAEEKRRKLLMDGPTIDVEVPCKTGVAKDVPGAIRLDLVRDLKLNLEKDLGITAWSADGIFLRPEITVTQVQNIARLVHAKNGWGPPKFYEAKL